jgi:hypothetical protein
MISWLKWILVEAILRKSTSDSTTYYAIAIEVDDEALLPLAKEALLLRMRKEVGDDAEIEYDLRYDPTGDCFEMAVAVNVTALERRRDQGAP